MLTAVVFLFTACQKEEGSVNPTTATSESGFHKSTGDIVTKMIAGGGKYDLNCTGIEVGTITVNDDGTTITVTYQITEPGWMIDATHLYVGPENGIPSGKKGNIKNGHFPFGGEHTPAETTVEIILTDDDYPTGDYVIAAHADVSGNLDGSVEDFCESLPETATIYLVTNKPISYVAITITDGGWLNGVYEGWCVDQAEPISTGYEYELSDVYCSYEELPDGIIHDTANLDLVNWIINQDYVGTASDCGGNFIVMDVQEAIWYLVDDEWEANPTCRTLEIIAEAEANGEGYVPGCGDEIAVIFDPGTGVQKMIIELPLVCGDETAWGYGYWAEGNYYDYGQDGPVANGISFTDSDYYGGKAWGWYFYGCTD